MNKLGKIAVFGEVMIELQMQEQDLLRRSVAGDTYNTAVMFAHMGFDTSYFSALGKEAFSQAVRQGMQKHGVSDDTVLSLANKQPGLYAISNDDKGERSFSYWRDTSAAKMLFSEPELFEQLLVQACDFDHFYWSGITLALMSEPVRQIWFRFLTEQRQLGKKVFFDTNYRAALWADRAHSLTCYQQAFALADWILPSLEDLQAILNLPITNEIFSYLDSLEGVSALLTSDGQVYYWHGGLRGCINLTFAAKMVDSTGAGDAFSGAFIAGLLTTGSIIDAVEFAHAAASKVVQYPGAILPDSEWIELNSQLEPGVTS